MLGYIFYSPKDIDKNRKYVDMHKECFGKMDVKLELKILGEDIDINIPDFVINRSRNCEISKKFEKNNIRVFNSSNVTEIANNKAESYRYLSEIVPFMPLTYKGETIVSKVEGVCLQQQKLEYPYVMKSCSGHGGSQVFMVHNDKQKMQAIKAMKIDEYICQMCCSDLGRDVRVYIVGNEIMAAMLRTSSNSFKSNYSLGGSVSEYKLNDIEKAYVKKITEKLPLDFAAIDFTFHNGQAVFNEIEDAAGARMLYANTDIDIVKLQTEYIRNLLR